MASGSERPSFRILWATAFGWARTSSARQSPVQKVAARRGGSRRCSHRRGGGSGSTARLIVGATARQAGERQSTTKTSRSTTSPSNSRVRRLPINPSEPSVVRARPAAVGERRAAAATCRTETRPRGCRERATSVWVSVRVSPRTRGITPNRRRSFSACPASTRSRPRSSRWTLPRARTARCSVGSEMPSSRATAVELRVSTSLSYRSAAGFGHGVRLLIHPRRASELMSASSTSRSWSSRQHASASSDL